MCARGVDPLVRRGAASFMRSCTFALTHRREKAQATATSMLCGIASFGATADARESRARRVPQPPRESGAARARGAPQRAGAHHLGLDHALGAAIHVSHHPFRALREMTGERNEGLPQRQARVARQKPLCRQPAQHCGRRPCDARRVSFWASPSPGPGLAADRSSFGSGVGQGPLEGHLDIRLTYG